MLTLGVGLHEYISGSVELQHRKVNWKFNVKQTELDQLQQNRAAELRRNVAAVASRWRHCVRFDWSGN